MSFLRIVVPLLNKRTSPVEDVSNKTNVVGQDKGNYQFESVGEVINSLGTWYRDRGGHYYWGGGIEKTGSCCTALDASQISLYIH